MSKKKTKLIGEPSKTGRGFDLVEFKDLYGAKCSLQESSKCIIQEDDGTVADPKGYIWLGIDDAEPQIMCSKAKENGVPRTGVNGWQPYPIPKDVLLNTRMHLNEHQARELIARLEHWLKTGRILTKEEDKS